MKLTIKHGGPYDVHTEEFVEALQISVKELFQKSNFALIHKIYKY